MDERKLDSTTTFKLCQLVFGDGKKLPMYLPVQSLVNQPLNDNLHHTNQTGAPPFLLKAPDVSYFNPPPPVGQYGLAPSFATQPTTTRPVVPYSQSTDSTLQSPRHVVPRPPPQWPSNHQMMAPQSHHGQHVGHGFFDGTNVMLPCNPNTSGSYLPSSVATIVDPSTNTNQTVNAEHNYYQYANQNIVQHLQQQHQKIIQPILTGYGERQSQAYASPDTNADPCCMDRSVKNVNGVVAPCPPPPYSIGLSYIAEQTSLPSVPRPNDSSLLSGGGFVCNSDVRVNENTFYPIPTISSTPAFNSPSVFMSSAVCNTPVMPPRSSTPILPFLFRGRRSQPVTQPPSTISSFSYARKFYQLKPELRRLNVTSKPPYNFTIGNGYHSLAQPLSNPNHQTAKIGGSSTSNLETHTKVPVIVWNKGTEREASQSSTIPTMEAGCHSAEVTIAPPLDNSRTVSSAVHIPVVKDDITTEDGLSYTVLTYDPENVTGEETCKDLRIRDVQNNNSEVNVRHTTESPPVTLLSILSSPTLAAREPGVVSTSRPIGDEPQHHPVSVPTTPSHTISETPCVLPVQKTKPLLVLKVRVPPKAVALNKSPNEDPLIDSVKSATINNVSVNVLVQTTPTSTKNEVPVIVPVPLQATQNSTIDEVSMNVSVPLQMATASKVIEPPFDAEPVESAIVSLTDSEPPESLAIASKSPIKECKTKAKECYSPRMDSTSSPKGAKRQTRMFEQLKPLPSAMIALCKNLGSKTTDEVLQEMADWASSKSRGKVLAASESLRGGSNLLNAIVKIERMVVEDLSYSDHEMEQMNTDAVAQDENESEEATTMENVSTSSYEERNDHDNMSADSSPNSCNVFKEIQVKRELFLENSVEEPFRVKMEPNETVPDFFPSTPTRDEYDLKLVVNGAINDEKVDSLFRSCSVVLESLNTPVLKTGSIDLKHVTRRELFMTPFGKRKADCAFGSKKVCVGKKCCVRSCRIANKLSKLVYFEEGGNCEWRATNMFEKRCVCCHSDDDQHQHKKPF